MTAGCLAASRPSAATWSCSACAPCPGCPCWEPANNGLPANTFVAAMTSASNEGSSPDRLVALRRTSSSTASYSFDGASWSLRSTLPNGFITPRPLLYVGSGDDLLQGNVAGFHTLDLGATWNMFQVIGEHMDVRAIYFDAGLARLYAANDGSSNSGAYWNIVRWKWSPGLLPSVPVGISHSGLRVWQTYFAAVVPPAIPFTPRRVFIGSQDNGSPCSDDGGTSWTASGVPGGLDALSIEFAPSDPDRAYARSNAGDRFYRSTNVRSGSSCTATCAAGGICWSRIDTPSDFVGAPTYWSRNITAVHPTIPTKVYFVTSYDIAISASSGDPGTFVRRKIPAGCVIPNCYSLTSIFVDGSGAIYAGTEDHGAWVSTDDGVTWTDWAIPGPPTVVWSIKRGATTPDATWWVSTTSGLYRKVGAGPWQLVLGGGNYIVNDLAVDPRHPNCVYAAFGYGGSRQRHRGGVQFSTSNGDAGTWSSMTSGLALHQAPVTDVETDPVGGDSHYLYAASFGHGYWFYNWGTALPAACSP